MARVKISQLYEKAFNIAPRFLVHKVGLPDSISPNYSDIPVWTEETTDQLSEFNTPILEQITLEQGSYFAFKALNGKIQKQKFAFTGYTFPGWPMLDVSQDKVIVTTPVNGRNGTIKEYIYLDDFQITIRGVLIGEGNQYPHDQRKALQNVYSVNSSYGVNSRVLNDQGIYALVFKNLSFTDVEGYNNVCGYTLTALSDLDVLLNITKA
jgi:hypothetical protein